MNCFYLKNLPDIPNRLLRSRICQNFGYCRVDIFSPKSDRKFNFGSCKIFLTHQRAESVDLFNLVPFECCNYDMGLDDATFISRWVKNDFGNISRHVSPDPFCCLKYDADDCKSDESLFFEFNKKLEMCQQNEIEEDLKVCENYDELHYKNLSTCDMNATNVYEENLNKIDLKTCSQGSVNIFCPGRDALKSDAFVCEVDENKILEKSFLEKFQEFNEKCEKHNAWIKNQKTILSYDIF